MKRFGVALKSSELLLPGLKSVPGRWWGYWSTPKPLSVHRMGTISQCLWWFHNFYLLNTSRIELIMWGEMNDPCINITCVNINDPSLFPSVLQEPFSGILAVVSIAWTYVWGILSNVTGQIIVHCLLTSCLPQYINPKPQGSALSQKYATSTWHKRA